MNKIYNLFFLTCLLGCNQTPEEQPILENVLLSINQEVITNSRAYSSLKEATQTIGHRLTGTENGKRAEEYVYKKFKSYGFDDVSYQEFEVNAWQRDSVFLEIQEGTDKVPLRAVTLGHSPIKASVTAEIIDVGNGLAGDYVQKRGSIVGKIALVYIGIFPGSGENLENLHRSEKTALAIEAGAAGVIIINQVEGGVLLTGTASVTGKLIQIPALCINREDGFLLKEKLKRGTVKANIYMTNNSGPIKARNVIAKIPGHKKPEEIIIAGGHLDSWDLATGAIDNGIGSFAVLDMARTFMATSLKPERSVWFVMFMGEEQGLLGSKHMVNQLRAAGEIQNIKYMMNVDMTGNPVGFNSAGRKEALSFFKELGEMINSIDSTFTNKERNRAGLHSDHQPFLLEGIPIISMVSNLDPSVYKCYHSDCDHFSLVDKDHITNTVRYGTMCLYAISSTPILPAQKLNELATKEFLIENGLKEQLILGNDWKWELQ